MKTKTPPLLQPTTTKSPSDQLHPQSPSRLPAPRKAAKPAFSVAAVWMRRPIPQSAIMFFSHIGVLSSCCPEARGCRSCMK